MKSQTTSRPAQRVTSAFASDLDLSLEEVEEELSYEFTKTVGKFLVRPNGLPVAPIDWLQEAFDPSGSHQVTRPDLRVFPESDKEKIKKWERVRLTKGEHNIATEPGEVKVPQLPGQKEHRRPMKFSAQQRARGRGEALEKARRDGQLDEIEHRVAAQERQIQWLAYQLNQSITEREQMREDLGLLVSDVRHAGTIEAAREAFARALGEDVYDPLRINAPKDEGGKRIVPARCGYEAGYASTLAQLATGNDPVLDRMKANLLLERNAMVSTWRAGTRLIYPELPPTGEANDPVPVEDREDAAALRAYNNKFRANQSKPWRGRGGGRKPRGRGRGYPRGRGRGRRANWNHNNPWQQEAGWNHNPWDQQAPYESRGAANSGEPPAAPYQPTNQPATRGRGRGRGRGTGRG